MDNKLFARIGAAVFVGLAVTVTLVQLLDEPRPRSDPPRVVQPLDGDPLALQLRACAEMGELALSSPDCRAAWTEKRRRFFGVEHSDAYSALGEAPDEPSTQASPAVGPES